jgi:hypothetical protein
VCFSRALFVVIIALSSIRFNIVIIIITIIIMILIGILSWWISNTLAAGSICQCTLSSTFVLVVPVKAAIVRLFVQYHATQRRRVLFGEIAQTKTERSVGKAEKQSGLVSVF